MGNTVVLLQWSSFQVMLAFKYLTTVSAKWSTKLAFILNHVTVSVIGWFACIAVLSDDTKTIGFSTSTKSALKIWYLSMTVKESMDDVLCTLQFQSSKCSYEWQHSIRLDVTVWLLLYPGRVSWGVHLLTHSQCTAMPTVWVEYP